MSLVYVISYINTRNGFLLIIFKVAFSYNGLVAGPSKRKNKISFFHICVLLLSCLSFAYRHIIAMQSDNTATRESIVFLEDDLNYYMRKENGLGRTGYRIKKEIIKPIAHEYDTRMM